MADQTARVLSDKELRERLRKWVVWLIDDQGTRQIDIAEALDTSQAHVSNMYKGKANVGLDTFAKLHFRLHMDPWRMLNRDPEPSARLRLPEGAQDARRRQAPGRKPAKK